MNSKRLLTTGIRILATAGLGIWVYKQPFLALTAIKEAAQKGDKQALNKHINFTALRESVKDNIRLALGERLRVPADTPLAGFGRIAVNAVLDPFVEKVVSPEGIAALAEGVKPTPPKTEPNPPSNAEQVTTIEPRRKVQVKSGYDSLDKYTVRYISAEDGRERVALVMSREGLLSWRLTGVRFGK